MNQVKLQAIREKEVAEKMMVCNDFVSARDHLLKAYKLYPAIDNIVSMLTLCDILTAARVELLGCGIDHYWVLQVTPSSTFADIRSQYHKLANLLQPIRTQFPCIKLAMELLQDAFEVLSDQKKRVEFNLKRITSWEKYKSFDLQLQPSSYQSSLTKENASSSQSSSAYKDSSNLSCEKGMCPKNAAPFVANRVNLEFMHKQKVEMIVKELNLSNMKSEQNIQAEVDKYADSVNLPTTLRPTILEENSLSSLKSTQHKRPFQYFFNFEDGRKLQHFETGQIWAVNHRGNEHHNYRYARIDSTTKAITCVTWLKPIPVSSSERRWCDAGLPVACGSFEVNSEMQMRIEVRWPSIAYNKCSWAHGVAEEQFEVYPRKGEVWAVYKDWNLDIWSYNPDSVKGCKFELVEIISDFSKCLGLYGACLVKVNGFTSIFERETIGGNPVSFHVPPSNLYIFSHIVLAYKFKGGELDKMVEGMFELDRLALPDYMIQGANTHKAGDTNEDNLTDFTLTGQLPFFNSTHENQILMPGWSQNDFVSGQVWAVYWGKDFMPRKYVRIKNVKSENHVCVSFLEPLPVLDHEIEWVKQDLPMVCGIFKVGERSGIIEMSLFSHLVRHTSKSCYKIYPLKGEFWAMYKGWNTKWKLADYRSYQSQIVQILSDFSEGDGITISRHEQVNGCLTFFQVQQYDGFDLIRGVSREDMLSFSHRIPAFQVPEIGKYGIPEDSWHLEPLALPPQACKNDLVM